LIVATALVLSATAVSANKKLASTTEALASLTVILLLANSYAIRQGWFLATDQSMYWAVAIAAVVAVATLFNFAINSKTLLYAAIVGAQLPVVLAVASATDQTTYVGLVLVAQALVTAVLGQRYGGSLSVFLSVLTTTLFSFGALLAFSYLAEGGDTQPEHIAPGLMVGLVAAALARLQRSDDGAVLYWAASTTALALSVAEAIRLSVDGPQRLAVGAAVLVVAAIAWAKTTGGLRRGAFAVLVTVNGVLLLPILSTLFTVAVLPFSWPNFVWQLPSDAIARDRVGAFVEQCFFDCPVVQETRFESWGGNNWQIIALLLLTVSAIALCMGAKQADVRKTIGIVGVGSAAWLGVVAIGATHLVTLFALVILVLVALAVSFGLQSKVQLGVIGGAALALTNLLAWSLASRSTSLMVFPTVAVGLVALSCVAVVWSRRDASYVLSLLSLAAAGAAVAVIGRSNEWTWPSVGVAIGVLYGVIYLVTIVLLNDQRQDRLAMVLQGGAAGGFFVGIAQQTEAAPTALMLASATALALVTALRRQHLAYWAAAAALGLSSIWAALVDQEIGVAQAYTVPAAVVLLLFGHALVRDGQTSSWTRYGAGVVTLVGPALIEALETESLGYLGWATAVSLGVLLVGVSLRLQAPLTVGSIGLLAIAIRLLGPYADEVPRWLVLGVPGLLLIVVGATWEQRRADVNKLVAAYQKLG
jgi:hypothetical protein